MSENCGLNEPSALGSKRRLGLQNLDPPIDLEVPPTCGADPIEPAGAKW